MQSYRPVNFISNDPNTLTFLAHQNPPSQSNPHHSHSHALPFQHNYYPTNTFQTENRSSQNKSITFTSRNPKQECIRLNPNNKPSQGYQFYNKAEVTIGNNYKNGSQSSKISEQPKFYCHPCVEQSDRTSIGLSLVEAYNPQKPYRRSQSLYKLRYSEAERQNTGKGYINSYRDVSEHIKANEPSNNSLQARISTPNCTDTTQIEQPQTKNKGQSPFISLFSKYDQSHQINATISDNHKQFNYMGYIDETKPSASKYSQPLPMRKQSSEYEKYVGYPSTTFRHKNSGQFEEKLKKDDSKDQFSLKKDYAKTLNTIGKDIEALKNATKQSKEVFEKEIEKNSYLSKLLERKASKASEQQISDWYKSQVSGASKEEKSISKDQQVADLKQKLQEDNKKLEQTNRQLQIQIIQLQKQLQNKAYELSQKNNEIWDKSKIIIDKNKTIDSISNELRQCKQKIQNSNQQLAQFKTLQDKLEKQNLEIAERDKKISEMHTSAQQILSFLEREKQQRYKLEQQNSQEINTLKQTISILNEKIQSLHQQNNKYNSKIQQLRQSLSSSDIQNFTLKSSIIAQQKEIMLLKTQIQSERAKIPSPKEMTSTSVEVIQSEIQESAAAELEQRSLEEQQLLNEQSSQDLEKEQKRNLYDIISSYEMREKQLAHLLLDGTQHDHEKIINRLKQLLQHSKSVEAAKAKEQQRIQEHQLYRMHHDYLEKKCQEMNRELKRAGNKLIGVSNQAHQGWKLLNQYNSEIILLNLINLNEKYRQTVQEDKTLQNASQECENGEFEVMKILVTMDGKEKTDCKEE